MGSNPTPATNPTGVEAIYRVYVIQNPLGTSYVGVSENVELRVVQHNEGLSKWTKGKGPWSLRWTSEAMSLSDARKLENKLKRQGRGSKFYTITGLRSASGS